MIQDESDGKLGFGPMEVDHVDEDGDGAWTSTGQTFTGKGANGEETLFLLQKRGNNFRVAPKGKGKGKTGGWHNPNGQVKEVKEEKVINQKEQVRGNWMQRWME